MAHEVNLIVNDRLPGFVRTEHARTLARFAGAVQMTAPHLGGVLRDIASALLEGRRVKIEFLP